MRDKHLDPNRVLQGAAQRGGGGILLHSFAGKNKAHQLLTHKLFERRLAPGQLAG